MTRSRRPFVVTRAALPRRVSRRLVLPSPNALLAEQRRRERFAKAIAREEFKRKRQ